ncbi:hypothetical protein SGRIM128S_00262 [Streptomyces griseomycini]
MAHDDPEREVRRRMAHHELYTDSAPGLERLEEERFRGKELAAEYNATGPRDQEARRALLDKLLGSVGRGVWIEPPLYVAYGSHVHLGDDVYVNFGLTLVDDVEVFVGDRVMFAPHVTISTTGHPVHPELRRDGSQFSAPVRIEDDVWIGRRGDPARRDRRAGLGRRRGQCGDRRRAADDGRRRDPGPRPAGRSPTRTGSGRTGRPVPHGPEPGPAPLTGHRARRRWSPRGPSRAGCPVRSRGRPRSLTGPSTAGGTGPPPSGRVAGCPARVSGRR